MRGKRAILRKFYVCGGISEVRVIFRYVFFTDFLTGATGDSVNTHSGGNCAFCLKHLSGSR